MERVHLTRCLFLAVLEQEKTEVMLPTSTIGIVTINVN